MNSFEDRMKARRAWLRADGNVDAFAIPKEFAEEGLTPAEAEAMKTAVFAEYCLENDDAMSGFWWLKGFLADHKVTSDFGSVDALADAILEGLELSATAQVSVK